MSTKKAPTEKRKEGEIYNFEKKTRKEKDKLKLVDAKKMTKQVIHLILNSHKGVYVKHYQTIS